MKLYELAKRIANFIWDFDPYNAMDYYESFGDAVSETVTSLCSKSERKTIMEFLADIAAENEETIDTDYANQLIREVAAL